MKSLFLLDPGIVFLNHGSFGACPAQVLECCHGWQREMERNPVEFLGRRSADLLAQARSRLAQYLGADPRHLVFVTNATTGVNIVAKSIPLGAGDEILTTDHEYGACDATWELIARRAGAAYRRVEIPLPFRAESFTDRIWAAVTPRTRAILLSHVSSTTALVFPVSELCRRARNAGILTCIDGAHVPGHIALDVDHVGADFYIGNCHKWLCAPKGAAFLQARPEHHRLVDATVVSWGYCAELAGHTGFDAYAGRTVLERRLQWQGTRDLAAFLAVPAAIDFQRQHDWPRLQKACHGTAMETLLRVCAMTGLEPICQERDFGQMVVVPVPWMDATLLKDTLFDRYHIEVPVTEHGGRLFVRVSVQAYNTPEDCDVLVAALKEIYRL